MPKPKSECWCYCVVYTKDMLAEPRRYPVQAVQHAIKKLDVFAWIHPKTYLWQIHDRHSGMFIVEHVDLGKALKHGRDYLRQSDNALIGMKNAMDVMLHSPITYIEAQERIKHAAKQRKRRETVS